MWRRLYEILHQVWHHHGAEAVASDARFDRADGIAHEVVDADAQERVSLLRCEALDLELMCGGSEQDAAACRLCGL